MPPSPWATQDAYTGVVNPRQQAVELDHQREQHAARDGQQPIG
jgi:hypothetical protein